MTVFPGLHLASVCGNIHVIVAISNMLNADLNIDPCKQPEFICRGLTESVAWITRVYANDVDEEHGTVLQALC